MMGTYVADVSVFNSGVAVRVEGLAPAKASEIAGRLAAALCEADEKVVPQDPAYSASHGYLFRIEKT